METVRGGNTPSASYKTHSSFACPPMALKCLERPSTRLLQRCYSTINAQPLPRPGHCRVCCAPFSPQLRPSSTRSFTSASLVRNLARRRDPSAHSPNRPWKNNAARNISSSANRSATPQEAHGSSITASYIASAGEVELVDVKKVLVIGSGGLSIGQAGEFDYSGM